MKIEIPDLSIGEQLFKARTEQDMLISQVSRALNVSPAILIALEKNEFDKAGAMVYVRGYLKRYAQFLSLDSDALDYRLKNVNTGLVDPKIIVIPKVEPKPYLFYYGVTLVASVLGICVWYFWYQGYNLNDSAPKSLENIQQNANSNNINNDNNNNNNNNNNINVPVDFAKQTTAENQIANPTLNNELPLVLKEPLNTPDLTEIVRQNEKYNNSNSLNKGLLVITVDGDNWTEIRDQTGKRILFETLRAGKTYTIEGTPPYTIKFGDSKTVTSMIYNNEDFVEKLIKSSERLTVRRIVIGEKTENN
ncbi:membrane protein [Gammaproteobacteria bacterium]|nr:membrane protein [Gammaproteobacteria bacterium]